MAKQQKEEQKYDTEVVTACRDYKKAVDAAAAASNSREQKLWARAAAAFAVSEVCAAKQVQYQRAAAKICNVPKQIITMDVKAEKLRLDLELVPTELPANSVSAMYHLHCGIEVGRKVAEKDPAQMAALKEKALEVAMAIKDGKISVRGVGAQFAEERKKLAVLRRSQRPVPEIAKASMLPPAIERLDAEALHGMVDALHVPSGISVPVLTITPPDATAKGIEAYFADAKMREAIASHCPAKGVMWILIDLNASEKAAEVPPVPTNSQPAAIPVAVDVAEPQVSSNPLAAPTTPDAIEPEAEDAIKLVKRDKRKRKKAA